MKDRQISILVVLSVFIVFLFTTCKKDKGNPGKYEQITTVRVFLNSANIVNAYEILDSNQVVTTRFNYTYSSHSILEKSKENKFKIYHLNNSGYIDAIIDSSASCYDTTFHFIYDENGYLKSYSDLHHFFVMQYNYALNSSYYVNSVGYLVELNETPNLMDFAINPSNYFMNLLHAGMQNKKLIKSIRWGFNAGPSTYPSESHFSYFFDNQGYITQKIEEWLPPYKLYTAMNEKDIKWYRTYYTYIRN